MREVKEIEYQMGEKELKRKLGLEGNLTMIITKTVIKNNEKYMVITIKMESLKVL